MSEKMRLICDESILDGLNLSPDSSGPSLEKKRLGMLCQSVFIKGLTSRPSLWGGDSRELSSVEGYKKKKNAHIFFQC